jgi:hypothetical protein
MDTIFIEEVPLYNIRITMALLPKAGARCGNNTLLDLCGGCQVTGIPTATGVLTLLPARA